MNPLDLMTRCAHCKSQDIRLGEATLSCSIEGRTFTATLPAAVCHECGEDYIDGPVLQRFELTVASALVLAGERSGSAVRFMRKALGYRALDLAALLGVSVETVSQWETDKILADAATLATLAALAHDALAQRTTTRDQLLALREPKPLAPVDLGRLE